ncbi:MAG: ASCH domain-containing protein [Planctomycetota bacterium]
MLLFKRKFLDAIRSGQKTQTIRLWKHRMMRDGQRSYTPGIGRIRIDRVEAVDVDQLTDADALPDGFASASALQAELRDIYGDKLAAGYQAFRVVLHTEADQPSGASESPAGGGG